MKSDATSRFASNLMQAKQFGDLHQSLSSMVTSALNLDDLLRAEIVFAVSTLDKLSHDAIEVRFIEMHQNQRPTTGTYRRFCRSHGIRPTDIDDVVRLGVRVSYGRQTFQRPSGIRQALTIACIGDPFPTVAAKLSLTLIDVETRLNQIVDRRNKIAHESDMDPSFPNFKVAIHYLQIREATKFIELIGTEIASML